MKTEEKNQEKILVVLKNWSFAVDKEKNKIIDYRAVYGELTKQTEKSLTISNKLVIPTDSILTFEFDVKEIPKEWEIKQFDSSKYTEIIGNSPIYIIE